MTPLHLARSSAEINAKIAEIEPKALGRGRTFRCHLVSGETAYLKQFGDNAAELELLKSIEGSVSQSRIAPKLISYCRTSQLMLLSSAVGRHPNQTCLMNNLSGFCRRLYLVHGIAQSAASSELKVAELLQDLHFGGLDSAQQTKATEILEPLRKHAFVNRYKGVLHGDLTPTNILYSDQGWQFIDWEYCCVGDIRWDLAAIANEFALSRKQTFQLLSEYQKGQNEKIEIGEFDKWRRAYLLICLGWSIRNDQPIDNYWRLLSEQD